MKKISKRIMGLMFEAYRRDCQKDLFEQAKPMTKRWLGLGTAAAYRAVLKSGLMVFHDGKSPPPRCMGWLCLTGKGVELLRKLTPEFEEEMKRMKEAGYDRSILAQYQLAGGITG